MNIIFTEINTIFNKNIIFCSKFFPKYCEFVHNIYNKNLNNNLNKLYLSILNKFKLSFKKIK